MNKPKGLLLSWLAVLVCAFFGAWPLELCWNYLVNTGFIPWHPATFWQAWCAVFVARSVLVKSVNDYGKDP